MSYDRIKDALIRFIETAMSRVDYFALYPAKVISQNGDGSLELRPDSTKLPQDLSKVPIRLGLPGVEVKVAAGARVLLGFENGNPNSPVATLWEKHSLNEIIITAATKVTIGGTGAEKTLKAETYRTAEDTMLGLVQTAMTQVAAAIPSIGTLIAAGPTAATACTAAAAGITSFQAVASTYLSTKVENQ